MSNDAARFFRRLLDSLERFLRRLLGRDRPEPVPTFPDAANPVRHFHIEVDDMKNATFSWTYPDTRQQGGPLDPADIIGCEISLRVVGVAEWTVLGRAPANEETFVQNELDDGDYEARARVVTTAVDAEGNDTEALGTPSELLFTVADDSPAIAVGSFGVSLS